MANFGLVMFTYVVLIQSYFAYIIAKISLFWINTEIKLYIPLSAIRDTLHLVYNESLEYVHFLISNVRICKNWFCKVVLLPQ